MILLGRKISPKSQRRPGELRQLGSPMLAPWTEAKLNSTGQPSTFIRKQVGRKKAVCKKGEAEQAPGVVRAVCQYPGSKNKGLGGGWQLWLCDRQHSVPNGI